MTQEFEGLAFQAANILLPKDCEYSKWAVVACDQYTSQPEYWQRVSDYVGSAPSALHLVLPESCLEGPDVETDIMEINNNMSTYLRHGRFKELPHALIYVERTLSSGKVRRGLVGRADLERYDYEAGAQSVIRATEGTVMSRIPPRVAVRKNAMIELPHIMLLCDDPQKQIIEPLAQRTDRMELLYDFDLMEDGGHLKGWLLDEDSVAQVAGGFRKLFGDNDALCDRYGLPRGSQVFQFAVGDGNHSLATAKECYERQKRLVKQDEWDKLPARWALCELVDLHDESLEFEPIHRVVFHVQPRALLDALLKAYPGAYEGEGEGHVLRYVTAAGEGAITIPKPKLQLPVASLQTFLDDYLVEHGGSVDYIHGEDVARDLGCRSGNIAFLLEAMEKEALFPTVIHDGALPRKTFSMGEANDKRFYLEARKIR